MPRPSSAMQPRNSNPAIIVWFERVEYACLALLILISATDLVAWLMPGPDWTMLGNWLPMHPTSTLDTLLSSLCLMFLGTGHSRWRHWISPLLAGAVTLLATLVLCTYAIAYVPGWATEFARSHALPWQTGMTPQSAGTFALLGITMLAMTAENRASVWLSDVLTLCLCIATFTLVSGYLFGKWSIFGTPAAVPTLRGTLFCLLLLTTLTVLRRTEGGIFSIYAGSGNGGNLARLLTPILLIAPFLREGSRARIIGVGKMPPHYVTALLASSAAVISISLLLYLVWRINEMETEIHALALRDELTGLHNLRGFKLLAGQAMRLALRSKVPFSVMYVDLDDLKLINDSLGHPMGSAYISEAAETLSETFRETDVLGRIGGDEFAVAGQFSQKSMSVIAQRLKDSCKQKNSHEGRQYSLSLSIGHATRDETNKMTLEELMATADEAMYEAKRLKKEQKGPRDQGKLRKGEKLPS
jgi:diguanylate cyclase (GGDEF)-like protein